MDIIRKLINKFKPKDVGHVAMLQLPKECVDGKWHSFSISVDGFNTQHNGSLTTFSGMVKVEGINKND